MMRAGQRTKRAGARDDPRGAIEAAPSSERRAPWDRTSCTNDCSTRLSLSPRLTAVYQLVAHAVGIGTADVIALEQELPAAADAHQLVADFGETRGRIAGTGEGENGRSQHSAVDSAARGTGLVWNRGSVPAHFVTIGANAAQRRDGGFHEFKIIEADERDLFRNRDVSTRAFEQRAQSEVVIDAEHRIDIRRLGEQVGKQRAAKRNRSRHSRSRR